ncbi:MULTISPECIES: hypothetical protein [Colwellia]|uniref:Uncharacterized protein n=1 Tax=Colwellia marinimaniae TaxID=1513592 RepID=A0ABQ0MWE6_9GAMM|nr:MULTISPECIES: hypothetical protein [Colwellia]GAW96680.1 hypothetical protein MTCD1_02300 [Colwellia marinimaniae]
MNIIIKNTACAKTKLNLSDLSDDIHIHLKSTFSDLIKSPNFQDILGAEKEDYFYVMLYMQKSAQVLQDQFNLPFKVADYFISNTKGEKLGHYAPFYHVVSCCEKLYEFTLMHGSLKFIIEVKYEFKGDDSDVYLRPLNECLEYFSDNFFKAQIKYVATLPSEHCHDVALTVNNKTALLGELMIDVNKELASQFESFKHTVPDWLVATVKGYGHLNIIISKRNDLIRSTIKSLFCNKFGVSKNDIGIRGLKFSRENISNIEINMSFVVTVDSTLEFRCCFVLMKPSVDSQARYLGKRKLLEYWKQDSESLLLFIKIEGCMLYDPVTYFLED